MSSRRVIILIGSLVIAALAGVLAFGYMRGLKDESARDTEMTSVLVVTRAVERGAAADDLIANGTIVPQQRRRIDLPVDAVTNPADIRGQKAAIALQANDVVTEGKFVSDGDLTPSKSASIEKGNVAVAVATDKVRGVSNLIEPGDYVNLMVRQAAPTTGTPDNPAASAGDGYVTMLYQKVKVLAIDSDLGNTVGYTGDQAQTGEQGSTLDQAKADAATIVFQVPAEASVLVASAEENGGLYLSLVRDDYKPTPVTSPAGRTDMPGEQGKTPYPAGEAEG